MFELIQIFCNGVNILSESSDDQEKFFLALRNPFLKPEAFVTDLNGRSVSEYGMELIFQSFFKRSLCSQIWSLLDTLAACQNNQSTFFFHLKNYRGQIRIGMQEPCQETWTVEHFYSSLMTQLNKAPMKFPTTYQKDHDLNQLRIVFW